MAEGDKIKEKTYVPHVKKNGYFKFLEGKKRKGGSS